MNKIINFTHINYSGYQTIPRWKKVSHRVTVDFMKDSGIERIGKYDIIIHPAPSSPESKFKITFRPGLKIDVEELSARIILALKDIESPTEIIKNEPDNSMAEYIDFKIKNLEDKFILYFKILGTISIAALILGIIF